MAEISLLEKVKINLRVKTTSLDEAEITPLIAAAKKRLENLGVVKDESDPLVFQAIVVYCKAEFGMDNAERDAYKQTFNNLLSELSLSKDYTTPEVSA